MRLAFIGGSHPRHMYYFNTIAHEYGAVGALIEQRENMLPTAPAGISDHDRHLWGIHFANREHYERKAFGMQNSLNVDDVRRVENINDPDNIGYIVDLKPDLVLVFGCHILRWYVNQPMINLHLGLSPRYRGSATLFWPFYFMEPQFAGCTFHQVVDEPDAGDILHQTRPTLAYGDTIHEVAARCVIGATADMLLLLRKFNDWKYHKQKNTGKCFLSSDFKPQHLRVIYDVYQDNIVNEYLSGRIPRNEPIMYQENLT